MTTESRVLVEGPEEDREGDPKPKRRPRPASLPEPEPTVVDDRGEPKGPEEDQEEDQATPEDVTRALRAGINVDVADETEVARRIVERIMRAETPDQLWEPIVPVGARQLSETPIKVFDFQALRSPHEGGVGVYLVIDAVDLLTGERLLVTCGASNVVAKLIRAAQLGALPENVKFTVTPSRANPERMVVDVRLVPPEQVP